MTLHRKLLAIQKIIPRIDKDTQNPHFKKNYASLPNILSVVLPIFHDQKLYLTNEQTYTVETGWTLTVQIVDSETVEIAKTTLPLLNVSDMQKMGSCITYAQRYGLLSLLGIAPESDDDGNSTAQNKVAISYKPKVESIENKIKLSATLRALYNNNMVALQKHDETKAKAIENGLVTNHKDVTEEMITKRIAFINDFLSNATK